MPTAEIFTLLLAVLLIGGVALGCHPVHRPGLESDPATATSQAPDADAQNCPATMLFSGLDRSDGASQRREIADAKSLGKRVRYLSRASWFTRGGWPPRVGCPDAGHQPIGTFRGPVPGPD